MMTLYRLTVERGTAINLFNNYKKKTDFHFYYFNTGTMTILILLGMQVWANGADPDQGQMQSDLGPHCLIPTTCFEGRISS